MSDATGNPLLEPWTAPHGLPPFDRVRPEHFAPAFEQAMHAHRDELDAVAARADDDAATVLAALDGAGQPLARLSHLFYNLTASHTSPALQQVQREMAPRLAAHEQAVLTHPGVFARLEALHERRDALGIDAETRRLLERLHLDHVRAGARLDAAARARHAQIVQRLATLTTQFAQNVLADESRWQLELHGEADLDGLPDGVRAAARQAAVDRGLADGHVVTLSRSLVVPFLTHSPRRDLREHVWRAWVGRGEGVGGASDNRDLVREILQLRAEQAALHGFACYADYALADTMAREQRAVRRLLDDVWTRALAALGRERDALRALQRELGGDEPLEAWDWRFWAERLRQRRYAIDDAEMKPYFALERMVAAAFDCAQRLFGLRFVPRADLPVYHPDVVAHEVFDAAGAPVGVFLHDNFARAGKRSGAWMSALRWQSQALGTTPVILNNNNFAKASPGEPTLLGFDDVRTLFHEFGHALHGLLSQARYRRLSGTQVLRDFVELPSQLFEHWALEPEVLRRHARHAATGEPIPDALIERLHAARHFGQGYETLRYTASAIVDLEAHAPGPGRTPDDPVVFERDVLRRLGAPHEAGMNHRLVHFQHLFSGSSYAAGYYVYLWAEVLDADAHDAFVEAGDPFDRATAERLRRHVYAAGNSVEPGATYVAFRGREARIEPMLRKKGLLAEV